MKMERSKRSQSKAPESVLLLSSEPLKERNEAKVKMVKEEKQKLRMPPVRWRLVARLIVRTW